MITRYRKKQRLIATIFLLIFFPTLVPNTLFASNNGPVAPEAASFEPVDAMDMVNLLTGDMSYVLPLLNVPSPEGGYSLALSNHAGIAMDQEASWVGLGWGLNPGAINRGVTGVPDDWKRAKVSQIVYDQGGVSTSYSGSISVGWGTNGASVGIYGSYTDNKSFGGVSSHSFDAGVQGSFLGITSSVGTNGGSIGYGGIKANIGKGNASIGFSDSGIDLALNQSFQGGGLSLNGSLDLGVGTGISFSSKSGLSASFVGQGFQSSNNNYGNGSLNLRTNSFSVPIQIYSVNIQLGYSRTRYWTYENRFTGYQGSLYSGDMDGFEQATNFDDVNVSDSYNSLFLKDNEKQENEDNLAFMAYDYYSVSGQGISGSFKPNVFEHGSLKNSVKVATSSSNSSITYKVGTDRKFTKTVNNSLNDIHFYFENDLSSFLRLSGGNWGFSPYAPNTPPVDYTDPHSFNSFSLIDGVLQDGYNSESKRKRTGNFIEAFTNQEIINSNNAIILKPEGYNRSSAPADGIGAFKITVLDGKVYHYSLPVYQNEQFTRGTKINSDINTSFFEKQQFLPYATHWLLTAITGPDYVDINLNNMVDDGDFGYWVSFDYGKWSDGYVWKTQTKNDGENKSYSWGVKEIYYLDKITTRTHTAIFVKEERDDDLSSSIQFGNSENDLDWKNARSRNLIKGKDGKWYYDGIYDNNFPASSPQAYWVMDAKWGQYVKCNVQKSLKLSKILLLKNLDFNLSKSSGIHNPSAFKGQIKFEEFYKETYWQNPVVHKDKNVLGHNRTWYGEYYNNVYDTKDFEGKNLEAKSVKSIVFNYNTNEILSKNAPNIQYPSQGRLTLSSVQFIGRNNNRIIPPYKFEYINDASYDATKEDNWGYYKDNPAMWSLNKIVTPLGAEINISYESDDFEKEAVAASGSLLSANDKNSGGVRVRDVSITDNSVVKNIVRYFYNVPGYGEKKTDINYKSSGITSYMPSKSFKEVKYLSELPSPGVLYEYVTVKNYSSTNKLGFTQEFNFNVLKSDVASVATSLKIPDILEIEKEQSSSWGGSSNGESYNMNFSRFNVRDMTANIGRLKQVKTFNNVGQLLSIKKHTYKDVLDIKQGISEETFNVYKRVNDGSSLTYRLGNTSKIKYPSILESTTLIKGGYSISDYFGKLDFLTGQVLENKTFSSNGQAFMTKIVPAYAIQQYKPSQGYGMGAKVDNPTNKNMLSQTAAEYSYILDKASNTWKETGVGITTWSNLWNYRDITGAVSSPAALNEKVWRKHKTFTWNGAKDTNGIFLNYGGNDDNFNWDLPTSVGIDVNQPTQWKQLSETTLYDHFSSPLEVKDINGNYAATKMGDNNTKIMVTGNAGYNEMFYCGAENTTNILGVNWLEPDIKMPYGERTTNYSHTGKYALVAIPITQFGVLMKNNEHRPGKYKVSVWVHKSAALNAVLRVNSVIVPFRESYAAGDWILKSAIIDVPSTDCSVYVNALDRSLDVILDDLMIRPVSSSITGYVYNEWGELTHIIGNNGLATRFEYDAAGRLIRTYVEVLDDADNGVSGGFKLKSVYKLNYKGLTQ